MNFICLVSITDAVALLIIYINNPLPEMEGDYLEFHISRSIFFSWLFNFLFIFWISSAGGSCSGIIPSSRRSFRTFWLFFVWSKEMLDSVQMQSLVCEHRHSERWDNRHIESDDNHQLSVLLHFLTRSVCRHQQSDLLASVSHFYRLWWPSLSRVRSCAKSYIREVAEAHEHTRTRLTHIHGDETQMSKWEI